MFAEKTMESSTTTGTGAYALGTPVGAFQAWRATVATGSMVFYYAENQDGTIWEAGYGTLTFGSPDSLSRTLLNSSTGALINWVSGDAPIYVMSVPMATAEKHMLAPLVNGVASVPLWLPAAAKWIDFSLGIAVAWIKKTYVSGTRTTATSHMDEGRAYLGLAGGFPNIFVPNPAKFWVDKGANSYAITADDVGKALLFDVTAALRTPTLPAGSTLPHGFALHVMGYGGTFNVVLTPNAADKIDAGIAGAVLNIPGTVTGGTVVRVEWDGAKSQWRTNYVAPTAPYSGVRQTVAAGPVDTAGLPTFLPSTNGTLSITSQNVSSTAPLVASAAGGSSATTGAPVDTVGYSSANLTWSGLTASRAAATPNYLYGTIASTGVITPASTILAPIYQRGGTPAVTLGQITFNIAEMKAYLGNGATAPVTALVLFGEAATDGSGVISTVAYAYNGQYDSGYTATLPAGVSVSKNHNLGLVPGNTDFRVQCTTTDQGFAAGEEIGFGSLYTLDNGGTLYSSPTLSAGRLSLAVATSNRAAPWYVLNKSSGGDVALAVANWKYRMTANRGW